MTIQFQYVHIYTECLLNPVQIKNSYKPLLKRYLASVSGGMFGSMMTSLCFCFPNCES